MLAIVFISLSLHLIQSIEEGSISDEISNDTEKSGDDANASVAQLKLQRDKLRVELNKSSEHKKKMEQYSIEAKQQAQRVLHHLRCICSV